MGIQEIAACAATVVAMCAMPMTVVIETFEPPFRQPLAANQFAWQPGKLNRGRG
jgi:hypothetical protein